MKNVYINAWRGPWGWRKSFYDFIHCEVYVSDDDVPFNVTDDINEADVVFQGDLTDWHKLLTLPPHVKVICNVLDFAEWLNNGELSLDVHDYVRSMNDRGAKFTAISEKVQQQLKLYYDIDADIFYYPSQIFADSMYPPNPPVPKRKQFITFARLGDPGKAITTAIAAFHDSGLASKGWQYMLVGPEYAPDVSPLPGVMHAGYIENPHTLASVINRAAYVVMPSRGEGLGLPIIEGSLMMTPFISRNIHPPKSIFKSIWDENCSFSDDHELVEAFKYAASDFKSKVYEDKIRRGFDIAKPWERQTAFWSLIRYIGEHL